MKKESINETTKAHTCSRVNIIHVRHHEAKRHTINIKSHNNFFSFFVFLASLKFCLSILIFVSVYFLKKL